MKRIVMIAMACMLMMCTAAAENDGDAVYTLIDGDGRELTRRAGEMFVGDEYIAEDNRMYRVVSVDHGTRTAEARAVTDDAAVETAVEKKDTGRLICMYSTHSDESYVPDDGTSSKWKDAGIYDVGEALKENLEEKGIEVVYSEDTFLPHDAGAYGRSRSTAEELLKKQPDALFDVHRDAIAAEQYETTVEGEEVSKVRLFVGRSNPNAASNKAFAKEIKAAADEKYPGLVKDIYIGRGNYNQELYGQALLLEMGTHEIDKDKAIASTEYLADVIETVLYGGSAKASSEETGAAPAAKGVAWFIGLAVLGAAVYGLIATGSFKGMWKKMKQGAGEITGGTVGGRHKK